MTFEVTRINDEFNFIISQQDFDIGQNADDVAEDILKWGTNEKYFDRYIFNVNDIIRSEEDKRLYDYVTECQENKRVIRSAEIFSEKEQFQEI